MFNRYMSVSRSLSVPKIFRPHKNIQKGFPTMIYENCSYPPLIKSCSSAKTPFLTRGFFIYSQEATIVMEDSLSSVSDLSYLEGL